MQPPAVDVEVRLFASLREAAGKDTLRLEFDGVPSVVEVLWRVLQELPQLGEMLLKEGRFSDRYKVMVGQDLVAVEDFPTVRVTGKMSILPPVSGG